MATSASTAGIHAVDLRDQTLQATDPPDTTRDGLAGDADDPVGDNGGHGRIGPQAGNLGGVKACRVPVDRVPEDAVGLDADALRS